MCDPDTTGSANEAIYRHRLEVARLVAKVQELEDERDERREIEAELVGALAHLTAEDLVPCWPPCPGHLGEKAHAMIREARAAWEDMKASRDRWHAAATQRAGIQDERDRLRSLVSLREREIAFLSGHLNASVENGDRLRELVDLMQKEAKIARRACSVAFPPDRAEGPQGP